MAMSASIASRRSPKPGAFTATDLKVPRILLTTRVARASPSTSLDAVFAELSLPEQHADNWLVDIREFMHGLRAALLRHPWSGALASSRPLLGPNALARSEFVYAALVGGGLTGSKLAAAAAAITNLVIGSVAAETAWQHDGEPAARQAVRAHLQRHAEDYPTLADLSPQHSDWDAHFDHSTELLLAGLAEYGPACE
jgi:tetracycline repressor-like protein